MCPADYKGVYELVAPHPELPSAVRAAHLLSDTLESKDTYLLAFHSFQSVQIHEASILSPETEISVMGLLFTPERDSIICLEDTFYWLASIPSSFTQIKMQLESDYKSASIHW